MKNNDSKNKRILFIAFEHRDVESFPSIVNSLILLNQNGYKVDVFLPEMMKTAFSSIGTDFYYLNNDKSRFILNAVRLAKKKEYDFIICSYIEGLYASMFINIFSFKRVPVIYFSMELFFESYKKYKRFLFNELRNRIKISTFIFYISWIVLHFYGKKIIKLGVVQDFNRYSVLIKEFPFIKDYMLVPNSYIGFLKYKSDYIYSEFGIDKSKKIILFTGGLERGFDLSIFKIADLFPENYLLFFNVYSRDNYLDEIKNIYECDRIFFNSRFLNNEEYTELVKSSDIGLAWYQGDFKDIPNMYYMGLSSGKLTKYLSCGKPVIVSDNLYKYKELIEENGLGVACSGSSEIAEAISFILNNYDEYQKNVALFYLKKIEFEQCFMNVVKFINNYPFQ